MFHSKSDVALIHHLERLLLFSVWLSVARRHFCGPSFYGAIRATIMDTIFRFIKCCLLIFRLFYFLFITSENSFKMTHKTIVRFCVCFWAVSRSIEREYGSFFLLCRFERCRHTVAVEEVTFGVCLFCHIMKPIREKCAITAIHYPENVFHRLDSMRIAHELAIFRLSVYKS